MRGWFDHPYEHSMAARGISCRAISRDSIPFIPKTYGLFNLSQVSRLNDPGKFAKKIAKAWKDGNDGLMYIWVYNFPDDKIAILTYDDLQVKWVLGIYGKRSDILRTLHKFKDERDRIEKEFPDGFRTYKSMTYYSDGSKRPPEMKEYKEPIPEFADIERMIYEIEHSQYRPSDMIMFTTTDAEDFDAMEEISRLWDTSGHNVVLSNMASEPERRSLRKFIFRTRDSI